MRLGILCSTVVLLFSTVVFSGPDYQPAPPAAVPGEILVKFRGGMQPLEMGSLYQLTGSKIIKHYPLIQGLQLVEVQGMDIQEALTSFNQHPLIEYAEPNYIVSIGEFERVEEFPNDEKFNELWNLHNVGQKDSAGNEGVSDADIDAPEAWETTQGSRDVIVAVIDTGIDYTHEDIAANMWKNEAEIADNKLDDDNNGFIDDIYGYDFYNNDGDSLDDHSHGTHVAGTIAGVGNNAKGVIGVAPNVRLMGVKFLSSGGSGSIADAVEAVQYATQMGAHVMNNSWGGGGFSQALYDAIKLANDASIIFTAAAGNNGANNDKSAHYPSTYDQPNVIAVASTNNRDLLSSFSNYGLETVDVAAPGEYVVSSVRDNLYASYRGTSMATPHVSGVAALLLSTEPSLTPLEVKNRIMSSSDEVIVLRRKVASSGRLNAYNAIHNINPPKGDPKGLNNWVSVAKKISTPHTYEPNSDETWTIEIPGATYIKIHFSRFDTEEKYDVVSIASAEGVMADQIDGTYSDTWSYAVPGGKAVIRFQSDASNQRYGFDIDKIRYTIDVPED